MWIIPAGFWFGSTQIQKREEKFEKVQVSFPFKSEYQHKLSKDSIHVRWFVHIADPRVEPVCIKSWGEILSSYVRVS